MPPALRRWRFRNASVGVNHALAHAFGARFGVAHGRANALMLPHVIAYNAAVPTKFMPSPYQKGFVAHSKNTPRSRICWVWAATRWKKR